ncbi:MAG: hypothetical protein NT063_05985 [Candidatus Methylopumilus sp.]|nr:hypothetical protein [Candidatus Methylopumilus sp.]
MNTTLLCRFALEFNHPLLDRFLTIGHAQSTKLSYEELICQLFDIKPSPDYPLASIDYQENQASYYLYADPVYLSLQRDTFFLEKRLTDDFTQNEIKDLCDSLNKIFQSDIQKFTLNHEGRLFLELTIRPKIKTTSFAHIKPQSIDLFMPQGEEAMSWHAFMNEIQMFLFDHPINHERSKRGALSANSIWFSGGGSLPKDILNRYAAIFSNAAFLKKLISIDAQISLQPLDILDQASFNQDTLIALENDEDIDRILGLIWNNFKKRKIKTLDIYISYQDHLLHIDNQFMQILKLWKKTNTVKKYFNVH